MKTTTLSAIFIMACIATYAQPVITSTMPVTAVGYTDNVSGAAATVAPGAGGAAVTWDLSGLSPSALGTVKIVSVAASPYAATFPSATLCSEITPTTGPVIYTYERTTATRREVIASNYRGVGTGKDYSPNPEAHLKFPFNYLETFTDTFQTTVSGPSTVVVTYDGYGTLKTPFGTYTDVVRIKKDWGPGDYGYDWVATTPVLNLIAGYDAQNNAYTLIGHATPAAILTAELRNSDVSVYPNPASGNTTITWNNADNATGLLTLTDVTGKIVKQVTISTPVTTLNTEDMAPGLYLYHLVAEGTNSVNGKLIVR